jgi:hypothetical protein
MNRLPGRTLLLKKLRTALSKDRYRCSSSSSLIQCSLDSVFGSFEAYSLLNEQEGNSLLPEESAEAVIGIGRVVKQNHEIRARYESSLYISGQQNRPGQCLRNF